MKVVLDILSAFNSELSYSGKLVTKLIQKVKYRPFHFDWEKT